MHAGLDEAFLCHVGFVVEGRPVVIPTAFGRDGEKLYLHGAPLSCMLTTLKVQRQPPRRRRQNGSGQR
jgi:nitroimidazol reductase NimA-like FMN-containing flavoprotein (pyridoxamine 5'-phosphate oxidase superfamily)